MVRGDGKLGQVNKMNIILLGAAGFIGKNLAIKLSKNCENRITLIDRTKDFFADNSLYTTESSLLTRDFAKDLYTVQKVVDCINKNTQEELL